MPQNLKKLRAPNMKNAKNKHKNKNSYELGKAWRNRWVLSWRLKAVSVGTLWTLFGSEFQTAEAA